MCALGFDHHLGFPKVSTYRGIQLISKSNSAMSKIRFRRRVQRPQHRWGEPMGPALCFIAPLTLSNFQTLPLSHSFTHPLSHALTHNHTSAATGRTRAKQNDTHSQIFELTLCFLVNRLEAVSVAELRGKGNMRSQLSHLGLLCVWARRAAWTAPETRGLGEGRGRRRALVVRASPLPALPPDEASQSGAGPIAMATHDNLGRDSATLRAWSHGTKSSTENKI